MHDHSEKLGQLGDYWLSKRPGSKQWCRTWYCAKSRQTKRESLGTADVQVAKVALYDWFSRFGAVSDQDPCVTPAALVFTRYYQQHASTLPSAEMARIALGYWSDYFGDRMVDEVTPTEQRKFVKALCQDRDLSDGYIKRILTVGKAAFSRAVREGEIKSAPPIITWADGTPTDRVLTVEESRALWVNAAKPHERMFLALAFGLMARPEAILSLTREQVDFDRKLIAQNPIGRKQTKKYRPTVPVAEFLLPMLEAAQPGPLVQWRGQPIASFKTAFRRIRRDAGLGQDVVAKTIRHTVATYMRGRGVNEADIQGFLGHRAFSGKTEVYAKYRPEYLGAARVAVDEYMALVLGIAG